MPKDLPIKILLSYISYDKLLAMLNLRDRGLVDCTGR
jgi:hypothetical protein